MTIEILHDPDRDEYLWAYEGGDVLIESRKWFKTREACVAHWSNFELMFLDATVQLVDKEWEG